VKRLLSLSSLAARTGTVDVCVEQKGECVEHFSSMDRVRPPAVYGPGDLNCCRCFD
jgi:hypothetical protein